MDKQAASSGFKRFLLIWSGQLVSLTGSGLTGFALGVWVYLTTGSVTRFALISLATTLPGILFSPFAGALVDRWNRRTAMILSDAGSGACTFAIAMLLIAGRLEIWHIYLLMAISSTFSAFQWPAFSAATALLVPKKQYGRASGLVQLAEAVGQLVAPVLGGLLVGLVQLQGVILIDLATFLFAIFTQLLVRIPRPPQLTAENIAARGSILKEAAFGWIYIKARPGLLGLLIFFAIINFTNSIGIVLFTPLVLNFSSAQALGALLSTAGLGMLAGALIMSAWGGPKNRMVGILCFTVIQGLMAILLGIPPSFALLAPAVFFYAGCSQLINGCSQAIWLIKTAPEVQGRVFAMRRMIAWSSIPLSYLIAGPLADRIFEPVMAQGGLLAGSMGQWIGVGPGRGIGLLYIVIALLTLLTTAAAFLYRPMRRVEKDLPDFAAPEAKSGQPVPAS